MAHDASNASAARATLRRRDALRAIAGLAAVGCGAGTPRERTLEGSALPPPAPAPAPNSDRRWERVTEVFAESLETSLAPGGAIGVVVDGKPTFMAARGVRKLGTSAPVTTSTLFRLESVTKTFTALAALSLVERKSLTLDAPVTDRVPSLSFVDGASGKDVTLRRLLTHTAGLARNPLRALRDVRRGSEYDDLFAKTALALGPVDRFEYSNSGYILVGAAIERATQRAFEDVLRMLVTTPLGIPSTTTDGNLARAREHADGFGLDVEGHERSFDPPSLDATVQRPVGGLHASVEDLTLFASRLLVGVPEVLRPETFADMTTAHTATNEPGVGYGYGLYTLDTPRGPVWTHTGAGLGSTAYFLCAPRARFAVVAMTNAGRYAGWRDVRRAAETAFLGAPLF